MKNNNIKRIMAEATDLGIILLVSLLLMCVLALSSGKGIMSFWLVCPIIYFLYQLCLGGAITEYTPGQALFGVRVMPVKEETIPPIDRVVRAIIKTMPLLVIVLFPQICYVTIMVGFLYLLIPFFHKEGKGIHDLAADTKVIYREEKCLQSAVEKEQKPEESKKDELEKEEFTPGMAVIDGEYKGAYIPLDKEVVLGRSPKCNLIFDDGLPEVSRRHCSIKYDYEKGAYLLTDLNSSYGTFLEDGSMLKGTSVLLGENAQFRIGKRETFVLRRS